MKKFLKYLIVFLLVVFVSEDIISQSKSDTKTTDSRSKKSGKKKKKYKLPNIDLSHWSVTIPVGKPTVVQPPDIMDYANNETLKKFMYNDSVRGGLVFYAFPNASTPNSKYSRSELREQMVPGDNNVNWTFEQGGTMKGRLAMDEVSRDKNGKYHKVMVMQIHGRLTDEQRDLIGQKDNNAPPILKIYWDNGKVRIKTKVLKDPGASDTAILDKDAWGDDDGYKFKEEVGFKPFTVEIKVTKGKMVISLNNTEFKSYSGNSLDRWGVFENYFKAGNYFQSKDEGSFARVMYFDLKVKH